MNGEISGAVLESSHPPPIKRLKKDYKEHR